jgi:MFS family permease
MIARFSLYGFLKNQQYYEPFFILAFLERGLSFFQIGLLVAAREICKVFLEIPSGAVADLYGRRRAMILSFGAYIVSFVMLASCRSFSLLVVAMLVFGIGEAFRTGTHKAMIFDWLSRNDRLGERTQVYGYTRSWSKLGSAVSAIIAAVFVFFSGEYVAVFWWSTVPYAIGMINFLSYPNYLDGSKKKGVSVVAAAKLSWRILVDSFTRKKLRLLILESMLLEGVFKVSKDYLQPVLVAVALSIPLLAMLGQDERLFQDAQRSAPLIGVVYFFYFLLMSGASRNAHRLIKKAGGENRAVRIIWVVNTLLFTAIGAACYMQWTLVAVAGFVGLAIVQNFFRPAQISRIDASSRSEHKATVLSIESQAKSLFAALAAPVIGYAVEALTTGDPSDISPFWPVAITGMGAGVLAILFFKKR